MRQTNPTDPNKRLQTPVPGPIFTVPSVPALQNYQTNPFDSATLLMAASISGCLSCIRVPWPRLRGRACRHRSLNMAQMSDRTWVTLMWRNGVGRSALANRCGLRVSTFRDISDRVERSNEEATEDARLVGEVRSGRADAFDALARRYQRRVFAVAYRLLSNRDDAWDVAQDSLLKALRSIGQLEDARRFGPWLMRIVRNLSLNYRRSRSMSATVDLDGAVEAIGAFRSPDGTPMTDPRAPDAEKRNPELRGAVADAMASLPEKHRLAFVLSAIEGVPQKEIAKMLSCTVELVKWNVFQARKALKLSLEAYAESDRG